MVSTLSTGIEKIDRELEGGVHEGSIISLNTPPDSQHEVFLQHFIRERDTLYISTTRSEKSIKKQLEFRDIDMANVGVKYVDPTDSVMENVLEYTKFPPTGSNVIIDIGNPLEEKDLGRVINFYQELKTHIVDNGGIAIVVNIDSNPMPKHRAYTMKMVDIVFNIERNHQGHETEILFNVPKYRTGTTINDSMKLDINELCEVDSTRQVG